MDNISDFINKYIILLHYIITLYYYIGYKEL